MYYFLMIFFFGALIILLLFIASTREDAFRRYINRLQVELTASHKAVSNLHASIERLTLSLSERDHMHEQDKSKYIKDVADKYKDLFKKWKEDELDKELKKLVEEKIEEWEEEIHTK